MTTGTRAGDQCMGPGGAPVGQGEEFGRAGGDAGDRAAGQLRRKVTLL
jgi:hypothetical protein